MSPTVAGEPHAQVRDAVRRLLDAAKAQESTERRWEPRFPYFYPATLTYRHREEEPISVFTRELSEVGIGLVHAMQLERGEVAITIGAGQHATTFRTYILWCKPSGPWHISGGQFLGVVQS